MTRRGRWTLRGIGGQIAALVIVSIVALHAIITASFFINRPDRSDPPAGGRHGQLATVVQLVGAAPAADRPHLAADLALAFPGWISRISRPARRPRRSSPIIPRSTASPGISARSTVSSHSQTDSGSASRCLTAR